MYHVSSPLRRMCKELAVSGRGCGEHMAVKALLISGNLPENRITFCYKLQSCRKPGFPRTAPLCVAAGARVQWAAKEGRQGKPCGGMHDAQSHLPGALAGHGWADTCGVFAKPINSHGH